jgi:hypothetical protein
MGDRTSRHSAEADDTPWHAVGLLTSQTSPHGIRRQSLALKIADS